MSDNREMKIVRNLCSRKKTRGIMVNFNKYQLYQDAPFLPGLRLTLSGLEKVLYSE